MPNLTPSRGPTLDAATYSTGCWGRYNAAWGGGLHSHLHNAACACTTPPAASQLHNAAKLDAKLDCGGLLSHLHNAACGGGGGRGGGGLLPQLHNAACGLLPQLHNAARLPPASHCGGFLQLHNAACGGLLQLCNGTCGGRLLLHLHNAASCGAETLLEN